MDSRPDSGRRRRRLSPLERIGEGIERMIHPSAPPPYPGSRAWLPELRVLDKRKETVLRLVSPRIDPRRIHIRLSGNVLTMSGAGTHLAPDEPNYRSFKRSIVLPPGSDWRSMTARIRGDVLTLRIRKLPQTRSAEPGATRKVRDLMTRVVKFVTPETPVAEAAALLRTFDIGSVPVVGDGKVVGILTDRDMAVRMAAFGLSPNETNASDIMTRDVVTCSEDDELVDAEQRMYDEQIRRLPVLDREKRLVGYLTLARIARNEPDLRSGHLLRGVSEPGRPRTLEAAPIDS
jgi:CBS domain-containing protein